MRNCKTFFRATAMIAAALTLAVPAARSQALRGDFNMDGKVDIADVTGTIGFLLNDGLPPCEPERDTVMAGGVPIVMVHVQGGTFITLDLFPRTVEMTDFWIAETEVTYELWNAVMNPTGSSTQGSKQAYYRMDWDACQEFIARLNGMTGMDFRLPSDDEWVYAAIGGNRSMFCRYAGGNDPCEVGWFQDNKPSGSTMQVGAKAPNELGLYDMSGNVMEYIDDVHISEVDVSENEDGSEIVEYVGCFMRGGSVDFESTSDQALLKNSYYLVTIRGRRPAGACGLRLVR